MSYRSFSRDAIATCTVLTAMAVVCDGYVVKRVLLNDRGR
jgi:hypothetical protein